MNHVQYDEWARYIQKVAVTYGSNVKSILDVSCGTGTLCLKLEKYGYCIFGCDQSMEMAKKATAKATAWKSARKFFCAEMTLSPVKSQVDMVISLYDSINYLRNDLQWCQCLNNIYANLKVDGLFVFDVSTLYNSMYVFKNYIHREANGEASYFRRSSFFKKSQIQKTEFEIKFRSKPGTVFYESHQQRIRSLDDIERLIASSKLTKIAAHDGFTFYPGSEKSERVHFILKKL